MQNKFGQYRAFAVFFFVSLSLGQAKAAAPIEACEGAFQRSEIAIAAAMVAKNNLVGRDAAINAVRTFFGWSSGMSEQLLTLRLAGKNVETKTYINGKLDPDSSLEGPPVKKIHILLTPDFLLSNEIKLNLMADTRDLAEFSGFYSLNGQTSARHHAIVVQQLKEQTAVRGANYEALAKSLHSRVNVAQTSNSLTIEFVEKSDPLVGAYTITVRFEKNSAGGISRVDITQGDAPSEYYQTTQHSYTVTAVVPFTPAEAYGR